MMGRGKFPRAALAANLSGAGIRMAMRAEAQIVGTSAEVAEQSLAAGYVMAIVAVTHRVPSKERLPLISRGPEPNRRPEAARFNGFESSEVENLVGVLRYYAADIGQSLFGGRQHQHPELM